MAPIDDASALVDRALSDGWRRNGVRVPCGAATFADHPLT